MSPVSDSFDHHESSLLWLNHWKLEIYLHAWIQLFITSYICKKVENAFKLLLMGENLKRLETNMLMVTKLLSVRQFDPTILQRSSLQLSKIYHHWMVWHSYYSKISY